MVDVEILKRLTWILYPETIRRINISFCSEWQHASDDVARDPGRVIYRT
jgi:hypothetical protein